MDLDFLKKLREVFSAQVFGIHSVKWRTKRETRVPIVLAYGCCSGSVPETPNVNLIDQFS